MHITFRALFSYAFMLLFNFFCVQIKRSKNRKVVSHITYFKHKFSVFFFFFIILLLSVSKSMQHEKKTNNNEHFHIRIVYVQFFYICNVVYLSHISHFANSAVQKKKTQLKYLFKCEFLSDGMSVNPFTFMFVVEVMYVQYGKKCAFLLLFKTSFKWNINAYLYYFGLDCLNCVLH